jgi:hypothetical protein
LIFLGVIGLLVSLLGEITVLGKYKSLPPNSWENFDQQLMIATPDLISLENRANSFINQSITEQEKMLIIYKLVINRFTHGDQAKYNVFSNWLLWMMGKVHPHFSYIRQPEVIVRNGHSALCSEQSYLLQVLAESQGIRSRSVGLDGHVVMEAWYDNDWHMFDSDLEVIPLLANNEILSVDELARLPELALQFYAGRGTQEYVKSIVDIITSRENNSFTSYPRLALFEWKTNALFHFEKMAVFIKWIIPIVLLLVGFRGFRKMRNN